MRYGVCFGVKNPERVGFTKNAGFDYVECGFRDLALSAPSVIEAFSAQLRRHSIRCEKANGFIPGEMKLHGPLYDEERVRSYIEEGCRRGSLLGVDTIVFGSSGARSIPQGMSYVEGVQGLIAFLRDVASPIAEKYGMKIAIEPLCRAETNVIHTVSEGAILAAATGRENVSCLADIYHMTLEHDVFETLPTLRGSVIHGHISCPFPKKNPSRDFPADPSEFDYQSFLDALRRADCGTCSVEAQTQDFERDVILAGNVLRSL